jgi:hypothetical protein
MSREDVEIVVSTKRDPPSATLPRGLESPCQPATKEGSVHAVVVRVTLEDIEAARRSLLEEVVPGVSQAPGFVTGYWTRKDDSGLAMVIFESEDAAEAMRERVPSLAPDVVTIEDVEVREVEAHA